MATTLVIDPEMKAFLERGLSTLVGTRSNDLVPYGVMGWAGRVSADGRVADIFIDRPSSGPVVENLRTNGQIAVTFTDCNTDRSIQLKGRCVEISDPETEDWPWIDEKREAVLRDLVGLGFAPQTIRNFWSSQLVRLRFVVSQIFDQTPGAGAGRAL